MDLVLFGIQGSGKGTQAKRLSAEKDYVVFETGAELRRIAAQETVLGRAVKSFIDQGVLAPIDVVMQVLESFIGQQSPQARVIYDGIPRDDEQRSRFDAVVRAAGRDFRCIQILLDPEEGVRRILGRAATEGRIDDAQEETIRRRMAVFQEKTVPVIDAYRREGKLIDVDGSGSMEEVYERIKLVMG